MASRPSGRVTEESLSQLIKQLSEISFTFEGTVMLSIKEPPKE